MEHTYNVCKNRGNSRIWIEGNRLSDMGHNRGKPFAVIVTETEITIDFTGNKPTRKIAGTETRPIIDCCGKWVTAFFSGATKYRAEFSSDKIVITGI